MKLIVVVDKNWAIGCQNDLLYDLPYDLSVNFKGKTLNKVVVVGSNTLKSFPKGKALKNRTNVVLCNTGEVFENCVMTTSVQELFEALSNYSDDDIYICGGASIYKLLYPYCNEAIITKVEAQTPNATAFMVNLDKEKYWSLKEQSEPLVDNNYTIRFCTYKNENPLPYRDQC